MKPALLASLLLAMLVPPVSASASKDLGEIRVLYVGIPQSDRARDFQEFLQPNLAAIGVASRHTFRPAEAEGYDVVLLDWPQEGELRDQKGHPFGPLHEWRRPTVLLGSAGLRTAVAWQVRGGSGCTCLYPFVYGATQHELFQRPLAVPLTRVRRPTPGVWAGEIKATEIEIVPLVEDRSRSWSSGWCTYSGDFERHPEVEWFCSGINDKTPTAAALWRQGNLFHFGFEQSPAEMNETGQALLLNAIAYISRFGDDHPIAVTPSVVVASPWYLRSQVQSRLEGRNGGISDAARMLDPATFAEVSKLAASEVAAWWKASGRFLHPDPEGRLTVDRDLQALGEPFDTPAFVARAIEQLRADGEAARRAALLLSRYLPDGPADSDAKAWEQWWKKNAPYLFALEAGGFRWHLDPLAQKRRVPTAELRGPLRADP